MRRQNTFPSASLSIILMLVVSSFVTAQTVITSATTAPAALHDRLTEAQNQLKQAQADYDAVQRSALEALKSQPQYVQAPAGF